MCNFYHCDKPAKTHFDKGWNLCDNHLNELLDIITKEINMGPLAVDFWFRGKGIRKPV